MGPEPWGRLFGLCAGLAIAAGLTPAASAYVVFFCRYGVGSTGVCWPGQRQCELQAYFLGQVVLDANIAAKLNGILGAFTFQRYGAKIQLWMAILHHVIGWLGLASGCAIEALALLPPKGTYIVLAMSMIIIDMGRGFIKYVPYAFLMYFPGRAGTVLAFGNAGHESASVFALGLIRMAQWSNMHMFGLVIIQVALGFSLFIFGSALLPETEVDTSPDDQAGEEVPTEDSPRAGEEDKGGICDETCFAMKDTCYCLYPNKCMHLFVLYVLGFGPIWSAQYQAIAVAWGEFLFQSTTDVESLTSSIAISTFITNCILSPILAPYLKCIGLSTVAFGLAVLQFASSLLVLEPTLWCQYFVGFVGCLMYAVEPILQGEHLFAYVDLRFAGMAAFLWSLLIFEFYMNGLGIQAYLFFKASEAADQVDAYKNTLFFVINIGSSAYLCYAIIRFIFPQPDTPGVHQYKQAELSKPYACKNFDQVSKILNYSLKWTQHILLQHAHDTKSWASLLSQIQIPALRDRLSQLTYAEISELLMSGNVFWKRNHTNIKQVKGLVMAGVTMPAAQFEMLLRLQVDVDSFGHGRSKSLDHLKEEMSNKTSSLEVDDDDPDKLVRVTTIVVLRISVDFEGGTYFLIEVGSIYSDDTVKDAFRFPAKKKEDKASIDRTIWKILQELGMQFVPVDIDNQHIETTSEISESESYPGLLTRYEKKLVGIQIVTTPENCLPNIGLTPKPIPWQKFRQTPLPESPRVDTEKRDQTKKKTEMSVQNRKSAEMYEWLLENAIYDREPQFSIHYAQPAPVKSTPSTVGLDLHMLLSDRKYMVNMLRCARHGQDWELEGMFLTAQCARCLRSLPYWLLDTQIEFHIDKYLTVLSTMIIDKKEKPHHDTLVESLLLDLFVHKQQAKKALSASKSQGCRRAALMSRR